MTKIGMIHSTIRQDEKLLIKAARERNVNLVPVDIRKQTLNPDFWHEQFDVVIERCISTTMGMYAINFFEALGVFVVNSAAVASLCEDKFATSLRLKKAAVPTVPFAMAFSEEQALEGVDQLGGYPIVIKPAKGSWGRLLAKVNDSQALEAILEHKQVLGTPPHKAFYLQKFIDKRGRDIRVTMVGDKVVCAIYRESSHWITNTARGAKVKPCSVNKKIKEISQAASAAVGGGVLGIDIFETDEGYLVNEVNHTTEFKNVQRVTGVDVAGAIIDYCLQIVQKI